jgi:hypothetical protein
MRKAYIAGLCGIMIFVGAGAVKSRSDSQAGGDAKKGVSYKGDVAPLLAQHCMPCHAEENANKSELYLDSYAQLMEGGKSGKAVVPGKPGKSDLILKLSENPPYGDRMPLFSKRRLVMAPPRYLTEEEVGVLRRWIEEGARDN